MEIRGWLFDLYPLESSVILWIKGEDEMIHRLEDSFRPRFYIQGKRKELLVLFHSLQKGRIAIGYQWTEKKEFWSGKEVEVMEIEVADAECYGQLPRILPQWEESVTFYHCDIPSHQLYLYEKGLFPTGRCIVETEGNRILEIHSDPSESIWMGDGNLPDLRMMELHTLNQNGSGQVIALECEGYRVEMENVDLQEIAKFLKHFDPDVILSDDGDASLLPLLFSLEKRWKTPIPWNREPYPLQRQVNPKGRSYFSYGRTYYRAPAHLFLGRWHIDRRNSFLYGESGMEGVIELARLAKIPIQRMARTSPGTAITSMQLDRAFQDGILIPWKKGEPEKFKTAWDLLISDKGGLVFQPKIGIFEDVAEIDFASMYPTIMATHNISPETVLCGCCQNHGVPEAGYTICERREGIVPKTLKPILARRAWLKERVKELEGEKRKVKSRDNSPPSPFSKGEGGYGIDFLCKKSEIYDRKQTALKWMLVTCFGYLGYRNARFGKIEAHEAVTAFGRENLLQAKEICEEEGFELLHAITDSLWIRKKNLNEEEVFELCRKISEATGIVMSLEGVYRWMVFLPSKRNPESPVANRYFGLFKSGKIKARGLSFRRGDMPPLIREAQMRMIEVLAEVKGMDDYQSKIPKILDLLLEYSLMLKDGQTKKENLAIGKTISQEPNAYKVDSLTALAAQQLEDVGIPIHPGEKVKYVIKDALSKDKGERVKPFPLVGPDDTYDVKKYLEMLIKATEELLIHLGYDVKKLMKMIDSSTIIGDCPHCLKIKSIPPFAKGLGGISLDR